MRSIRTILGLVLLSLAVSQFAVVVFVRAAANSVPITKADEDTAVIDPGALKPSECAALNISELVFGDGNLMGSSEDELLLGGPADQTINGSTGDDCLLGGGGSDTLRGGPGDDICIGSATSTFQQCETEYVQ